jgi:hypothetical protein
MIKTITSPRTKLYIPTQIGAAGRRLMSVSRNELIRYVSFPDADQAQDTIDALRHGELVHVTGEILTSNVARRVPQHDNSGEMIVWETSVDAIMRMAGPTKFGVDMCEFVAPHFVVLEAVYVSPHKTSKDNKKLLEDMLKL